METLIAGWGFLTQQVCISNKFPGDANAAGPGTHFENHCFTS